MNKNKKIIKDFKQTNQPKKLINIFLLIGIILATYFVIFSNEFVFDDTSFILGDVLNHKNLNNILKFFSLPTGELYRPIRSIVYSLSYSIWGTNTFGYHLNSILFHIVCTILVYLIATLLLKENKIALFAGLLFAVHPIHTESVTFMTATFDLVGPVFYFLSLYLYVNRYNQTLQVVKNSGHLNFLYITSVTLFVIAVFSSEMCLTLPFILILVDWYLLQNFNIKEFIGRFKYYLPFFIVASIYVFIRFAVLGITGRASTEHYLAYSKYWTLLTMTKVFVYYIYLLFIPKLNSQPDYEGFFRLATSFFEPGVIVSTIVLLSLIITAVIWYRKSKIVSFSIIWFFLTLLPVSNIIVMKNIMAERHLYIPSMATCIFIPIALKKIFTNRPKRFIFLTILLLVIYGGFTIKRNADWKDAITLWSQALKNFPGSGKAYRGIGCAYAEKKQFDLAISNFKQLQKLDPDDIENLHNLGNAYIEKGEYDSAIEIFKEILKFNQKDTNTFFKIGVLYSKKNNPDIAMKYFNQVLEIDPNNPEIYVQIGYFYFEKGHFDLALEKFKKSIEVQPTFHAYNNIGAIFATKGLFDHAIFNYERALEINPNDTQCHIDLGHIYLSKGLYEKARDEFRKALAIDPTNQDANNYYRITISKIQER